MDDISIIIPTKDAGAEWETLLQKLNTQRVDADVEIVVVDSGSSDRTVGIAHDYADIVIEIPPEEFHHSRTRAIGADHAHGDILVFTVQDAIPVSDNWLAKLVRPLARGEVGITYGRQIAKQGAKPMDQFFYNYFYPDEQNTIRPDDVPDPRSFYLGYVYISSVNAAMRRSIQQEVGLRSDVAMAEDKDLALRALNEGYSLAYVPKAQVRHSHDYSLRSLWRRRFKDGQAYAQIASQGDDKFLSMGINYVLTEFKFLTMTGAPHWIPYAMLYEFIHFISFQAGKNHNKIPEWLLGVFDA